ncbi:hypothetical protein Vafri_6327 [Volvox africanus]|uniref:Uncharacterized protein n=1 Tax=Volvox africanus TaxID=51714 RepID=A0A8J4AYC0_9CHLO|nr:hypothetical protein Vafri_6327 [Volvox africanus]
MPTTPRPRPNWATVGRMSSPGLSSVSITSSSPSKEDEKGLRSSVATSSPRHFAEFGSPGRCGGSGLAALPGCKTDYDIIRFFTARDIIDLINNLQRSAKIAGDEAGSIHGCEQANRVKAKCSKVCGLSNRLIDLYVATIKAKVARILRKLGLGQARGQDLLYSHLMTLQALVDKAFASFNAVQHAEAARIKQGKLGADNRRENSGAVTWRTPATPAEQKPASRQGSQGSLPQPAQHMDVRNLLLEARKQFLLMAEELVDLKNNIIVIDRTRIHEAVVEAVAEGEVPDPLPKMKGAPDGIAYGFNTRYVSEGGCNVTGLSLRTVTEAAVGYPLSPRREASASSTPYSPRTSRLVNATFEIPPADDAHSRMSGLEQARMRLFGLRSVSLPGDAVESQSHSPSSTGSPCILESSHFLTPRSRRVISQGGDSDYASSDAFSSRQATARNLFRVDALQATGQVSDTSTLAGPEGQATCHIKRISLLQTANAPEQHCQLSSAALHPRSRFCASGNEGAMSQLPLEDDAPSIRSPCMGEERKPGLESNDHTATVYQTPSPEDYSRRHPELESLRELALEALRLVERDPTALDSAFVALNMSRAQLDEAAARCQAHDASGIDMQAMLRICLTLLGQQLRSPSVLSDANANDGVSRLTERGTPFQQPCPRYGELAVLLDQVLPLLNAASTGDRTATADLGSAKGPSELAADGSQDEVVLLPLAADVDATDTGDMAHEALATVLQRLSTVLDRLRHLEEESAEMEQTLAQERQVRTDVEAEAARLQADHNERNDALAVTQQLLTESERQLELLRTQFVELNHELGAKSAEIAVLQQQQQQDGSKREIAPPSSVIGLFKMNMLNATELELEGLRIEHENLRSKTELQGAELRRLQNEVSGLRAARDKLVDELQEMQLLLQQRDASSVQDGPILVLKGRGAAEAKAAAIAPSRGTVGAAGTGSLTGKDCRSNVAIVASSTLTGGSVRASATYGAGRVAPSTTNSKAKAGKDLCNRIDNSSKALRPPNSTVATIHSVKRCIPPQSGPGVHVSGSSSGPSTPRVHFCALARLEEVQVQLAQAEAARQALEYQLQAAQSLIASKDSEIDTANLILREYERRSLSAANPTNKQAAKLYASVNVPLLQLTAGDLGSCHAAGDALAVVSISPAQRALSDGSYSTRAALTPAATAHSQIDLIARLEELQTQCEELICRAADLDTERSQAQLDADERAAELQATKEYITELEEEVELLRELADKTTQQMLEKERDIAAQEQALLEAREALARARAECNTQVNVVEAQAAQLELAHAKCQAAQVRVLELEARDEAQSCADADALACLREEVLHLERQFAASQAALADANEDLAAARAVAIASEQAATADRQAVEKLRWRASENEDIHLELANKLAVAEQAQSSFAAQLGDAAEDRQQLIVQLGTLTQARENLATQFGIKEATFAEALLRLEQREKSLRQLEAQMLTDASVREDLQASLAVMKAEHQDLQRQVVNDRTAVRDLHEKLAETEMARLELADKLEKSVVACADLEQQLISTQVNCRDQKASLTLASEAPPCTEASLVREEAAVDLLKPASASAAGDSAACKADAVDMLKSEVVHAEAKAQALSDQVRAFEQQLRCAHEKEAIMQEQMLVFAAARAAEAEQAVVSLRGALSAVKARLESVRSEAAIQAVKVETLEVYLAHAASERERLELQAATAAAHSQMLEEQLRQAQAENALLEQELGVARTGIQEQAALSASQADQLAAAHALNTEQRERFAAEVTSMQVQLQAAFASKAELAQRSACQASELEAHAAAARNANTQQAAQFASHSSGLEAQLVEARAAVERQAKDAATRMKVLEERLGEAEAFSSKQGDLYRASVEELESKLASARAAIIEHTTITATHVEKLESQLAAERLQSVAQAERSSTQVSVLLEQLMAARTEMVQEAHTSAARAVNLEVQLAAARSAVGALVERSAAEVSGLIAQLDAARKSGVAEAEKVAQRVTELELKLASTQTAHAALADRSVTKVAELEARLIAALAENIEHAKCSATQATDLEHKLTTALALASEYTASQTAQLTAQVVVARTAMSEQAERASADAAELVKQLEAAHAEIAAQVERSAAQASELEQQLSAARAKNSELLSRSAVESAAWETRISAAQEQHAVQTEAFAAQVADLEARLTAARTEIADQMKRSSVHVEALEEQLVAAHAEYAIQAERSTAQTQALEAQVAAAQAAIAEQTRSLTTHVAVLEAELAVTRAENFELASSFTLQTAELEVRLTTAQAERNSEAERHAAHITDMEAQLYVSKASTVRHANRAAALATAYEEQIVAVREDSTAQEERIRALEAELRTVLDTLGTARDSQERHAEDVKHLIVEEQEQKKQLYLRQSEVQQLKDTVAGLQAKLQDREVAVADREIQLENARKELESAVAVLGQLQTTVERLQLAASAVTAAGAAASNAAAAAADQQEVNLAITAREQAKLRSLLSELEGIAQPHMVLALKDEVATLKAAKDGNAWQPRDASEQDVTFAMCREVTQRQEPNVVANFDSPALRVHEAQLAAKEFGGEDSCLQLERQNRTGLVITHAMGTAQQSSRALKGKVDVKGSLAAEEQELTSLESSAEAMQRQANAHAERRLASAEGVVAEVQARQWASEAEARVIQDLRAAVEEQACARLQLSYDIQEHSKDLAEELAGVQQLLKRQRRASAADLLETLTAKLAAADSDLHGAKAHVEELKSELTHATRRVAAAELAARTADMEKHQIEVRLAAAVADSNSGRAMVQELTVELARYRKEVDLVHKSMLVKQALLDEHESEQLAPEQAENRNLWEDSMPAADVELQFDTELATDFLEGCIWGMGLGSASVPAPTLSGCPLASVTPAQRPVEAQEHRSGLASASAVRQPARSVSDEARIANLRIACPYHVHFVMVT